MDIVYAFEVVGGPFDGSPGFEWLDDGKHPPPETIFVGVCRAKMDCGSVSCKRGATHVSYWTAGDESRPPDAMPYPKENEYVVRQERTGGVSGRAVYAVGGLRDPKNFGEAAREPIERDFAGVMGEPRVTAYGDPDDVLLSIIREAWDGEGRDARPIPLDGVTIFSARFGMQHEPIDVPLPVGPVERSGVLRFEAVDSAFVFDVWEYAVRSQLGEFRP